MSAVQPLVGVKVLELGELVAVPFAAQLLTSLGTETVKVEPLRGDVGRRIGPFVADDPDLDSGVVHLYLNRSKRSVALDLGTPTGRDVLDALAADADVILADETLLDALGWEEGVEWLRAQEGIRAVLTPFGLTGPAADLPSSPLVSYQTGLYGSFIPTEPSRLDFHDRGPVAAGGFWGEYQCGATMALPVMAACLRETGAFLELSRQEALVNMVRTEAERWPVLGRRISHSNPYYSVVGGILEVADGYVSMVLMEHDQWLRALALLGDPDWADDPRLETQADRLQNWPIAYARLAEETRKFGKWELFQRGQETGVPVAPVLTMAELAQPDHQLRPGGLVEIEVGERRLQMPGWPAEFGGDRLPVDALGVAPRLGADTVEVLAGAGYPTADIAAMHRMEIVRAA
jgi:crotonobetainyl-CoA:carnitine CoA-transferase CaiB-like acyl-CoA transferase